MSAGINFQSAEQEGDKKKARAADDQLSGLSLAVHGEATHLGRQRSARVRVLSSVLPLGETCCRAVRAKQPKCQHLSPATMR